MVGFAIGFGGCVTAVALHMILAYLRKTAQEIAAPRQRMVAAAPAPVHPPSAEEQLGDPRVARIISEIPRRRTRQHTYLAA